MGIGELSAEAAGRLAATNEQRIQESHSAKLHERAVSQSRGRPPSFQQQPPCTTEQENRTIPAEIVSPM